MQVRLLVLAGLMAVSLAGNAQACFLRGRSKCCNQNCCDNACGAGANAGGMVTVNCIEWVKEQRQVCCTTYKMEQRQVTCNGCRCETHMEPRTRTVCCTRRVTETVMETRTVCERVPY